jgi:hypothetical protein
MSCLVYVMLCHVVPCTGSGLLNLTAAVSQLRLFTPHVSAIPSRISNFRQDCPLLWPWCEQQLFSSSQPFIATLTLLNSISSTSFVARIEWVETSSLGVHTDEISFVVSDSNNVFDSSDDDSDDGSMFSVTLRTEALTVRIQSQRAYWPYSGTMEVAVSVNKKEEAAPPWSPSNPNPKPNPNKKEEATRHGHGGPRPSANANHGATSTGFIGEVICQLKITLRPPPEEETSSSRRQHDHTTPSTPHETDYHATNSKSNSEAKFKTKSNTESNTESSTAIVTLRLNVTSPPDRKRRILWDTFHTLSFPSAFIPNDNPSDSR